jgi:hypothetical protein
MLKEERECPKEVLEVGGGSGLKVLFEPQPEMLPYSPS